MIAFERRRPAALLYHVLAHLDLVKKGLTTSVKVLGESGSLLVGFGKDLSGFKG